MVRTRFTSILWKITLLFILIAVDPAFSAVSVRYSRGFSVAFIGIAVPHLAKTASCTADHRILLPVTAILGSITVLPLNGVTALIGSPVIIWFIIRNQRKRQFFQ